MTRHLLGLDDAEERIGRDAAIFLGETELQQAGGRGLAIELAWELLGLVPLVDMGHDLAFDEAPHGAPERLVLLGIERRRRPARGDGLLGERHEDSPVTSSGSVNSTVRAPENPLTLRSAAMSYDSS